MAPGSRLYEADNGKSRNQMIGASSGRGGFEALEKGGANQGGGQDERVGRFRKVPKKRGHGPRTFDGADKPASNQKEAGLRWEGMKGDSEDLPR